MKLPRLSPGTLVAAVFIGTALIALGVTYLFRDVPSQEESCIKQCTTANRSWRMVNVYPKEQTAGMRGKGPMRCECY